MGEVIQLQGDQRKNVQEFLVNEKEGLGLDSKTIKVRETFVTIFIPSISGLLLMHNGLGPRFLSPPRLPRQSHPRPRD